MFVWYTDLPLSLFRVLGIYWRMQALVHLWSEIQEIGTLYFLCQYKRRGDQLLWDCIMNKAALGKHRLILLLYDRLLFLEHIFLFTSLLVQQSAVFSSVTQQTLSRIVLECHCSLSPC